MKRTLPAALIVLATAIALPAQESERAPYLVATTRPAHDTLVREILGEGGAKIEEQRAHAFESVNGFAAELTTAEVARLRRSPNVRWVEPVVGRHAMAVNPTPQVTPYGITMTNAPGVWAATRGQSVNVVVCDTGLDYTHPDLRAVYAGGFDFINRDADPMDDDSHGTHCAGSIAAADNDTGVVGVAPRVRLWSLKVLDRKGNGTTEELIRALDWVIAKKKELGGRWIVSMSLGSDETSLLEREAFERTSAEGLLCVAASGNESNITGIAPVAFPAAYPSVIAVGAVDSQQRIAAFSNQGSQLDLVAPGVSVLSTVPTGSRAIGYVHDDTRLFPGAGLVGSPKGTSTAGFVYCGLGNANEIPASVAGKIALIRRGDITFAEKARNAKNAGAIAVVIFNRELSSLDWSLVTSTSPAADLSYAWPLSVGITQEAGEELLRTPNAVLSIGFRNDDYEMKSGTSMSTPHVAAVAALLWSLRPDLSAVEITKAMTDTARDRGRAGFDETYGHGIVDALAAAKAIAPGAFEIGSPISPAPVPRSGRPMGKRH